MTEVKAFGRLTGFVVGFGLAMLALMAANVLYRGIWMPLALVGAIGALFSWHPRLARCPASPWFIAFLAVMGSVVWMVTVGPSPVRLAGTVRGLPLLGLLFALFTLIIFFRRNSLAKADSVIYLPVAALFTMLVCTVISFSGSSGGADPMVQFAMDRFGLSKGGAETLIIAIRKTIHFSGYGIIAWSAYRLANPKFDLRAAGLFGLGVALSVGIFDEFRQSTATNRTGSAWDVGLDMLGALAFVGFSVLRYRHRSQPPGSAPRLPA